MTHIQAPNHNQATNTIPPSPISRRPNHTPAPNPTPPSQFASTSKYYQMALSPYPINTILNASLGTEHVWLTGSLKTPAHTENGQAPPVPKIFTSWRYPHPQSSSNSRTLTHPCQIILPTTPHPPVETTNPSSLPSHHHRRFHSNPPLLLSARRG